MTSLSPIGNEPQSLEGRSVRDIVEYSPEFVNEAWCRKIFRRILQSLELQYAMQMPHRGITPDTIVFHDNGEPLLSPDLIDADAVVSEADDLTALATVIHYAITSELLPGGPLRGRALEGYSDSLISAVDRCMAPDPAQRPQNIEELRGILGIVSLGASADAMPPAPFDDAEPDEIPGAVVPADGTSVEAASAPPASAEAASGSPSPEPIPTSTTISATSATSTTVPASATVLPTTAVPPSTTVPTRATAPPSTTIPASATTTSSTTGAAAATTAAPAADDPFSKRRPGLSRRQRWAIAAGGAAVLVAIALLMFADMRDSGSFDHIVLGQPQADAPAAVQAPGAAAAAGPAAPQAATGAVVAAAGTTVAPAAPDATAASSSAAPNEGSATPGPDAAAGAVQLDPTRPADASAIDAAPGAGATYRLRIQPWGAIYVDGVQRGVSPPVKRLILAPGKHTLRVTNPAFPDRVLDIDTARGGGQVVVDFNDAH